LAVNFLREKSFIGLEAILLRMIPAILIELAIGHCITGDNAGNLPSSSGTREGRGFKVY